ncbi:MMPL family transporter [Mycolicibacterium sp.]|uniref:MMPL family transporter n=1 Tax=Mycolicibacterium sp. TaxID=2320850 RepID=UPI001A1EC3CC|nr:MMPL family transporter [Mycolicibacterium sp.]MBJ7341498.1 MMPL family transporter [Mycolicibacterium sp.]
MTRRPWLTVLLWVAIGTALTLAVPSLENVTRENAVSPMPTGTPATTVMQEMGHRFGQEGIDNSAIIVMRDPDGLTPSARVHYEAAVQRLRADTRSVRFVQDLLSDPIAASAPSARAQVMSEDGQAWFMLVGLQGEIGSPNSLIALQRVRSTVEQTFADSGVTAKVTGPTATFSDMAESSFGDLTKIAGIVALAITALLLLVYRSFFTAAVPLIVMSLSLIVVRGLLATMGHFGLLKLSAFSSALMMTILAGACVNYTVFLLSRYHERIRAGMAPTDAIACASGSVSSVTLAAAATVAVANMAQLTAKLALLAVAGPAIAAAIVVAFLANVTLAQALLALAARRGWGMPRAERTRDHWRKTGIQVVRHPARTLTASLLILAVLAGCAGFVEFGYDDQAQVARLSTESGEGYQLLSQHFDANAVIPQFVMVTADRDLRTPRGLADLDQMAQRMSQLPGVAKVVGITRPDGQTLGPATLSWQIGAIGTQVDRVRGELATDLQPQLDRIVETSTVISSMVSEFTGSDLSRLQRVIPQLLDDAAAVSAEFNRYRPLLRQLRETTLLIDQLDATGPAIDAALADARTGADVVGPIGDALAVSPACAGNPRCAQYQQWLSSFANVDRVRVLDEIGELARALRANSTDQSFSDLTRRVDEISAVLDELPGLRARYERASASLRQLQQLGVTPAEMRALGDKTRELATRLHDSTSAMGRAAAFLHEVRRDSTGSSGSGFYLPAGLLDSPDFRTAADRFLTPDGTTAVYFIQSTLNPYSTAAMDLVGDLKRVGAESTPNTELAGAEIGVGGFPALNADLQRTFIRDFKEIVVVTLLVIVAIMCLLLRAVVAPLYLIATVVLTYGAALGAGVLVFQGLLGQPIYWAVPALTFVMIVAVGADYNMLFISRLREESTRGIRTGVIRTVTATGSVITSAGLIFAASTFGMTSASLQNIAQVGFIIGVGLLLDTFVVRTLVVPSIAVMLGQRNWWPARS